MKVSYNWLKDYLDIDKPVDEVSEILTNLGLEVEKVEDFESIKGSLEGIIVGEVLTCKKHPNADKLKICKVNDGETINQVVCGAPNGSEGKIIAYATIGTILPGNFKIKKVKIRGEESLGMICYERELQISDEHDGIMVLP